jgi:hypothetical protein
MGKNAGDVLDAMEPLDPVTLYECNQTRLKLLVNTKVHVHEFNRNPVVVHQGVALLCAGKLEELPVIASARR